LNINRHNRNVSRPNVLLANPSTEFSGSARKIRTSHHSPPVGRRHSYPYPSYSPNCPRIPHAGRTVLPLATKHHQVSGAASSVTFGRTTRATSAARAGYPRARLLNRMLRTSPYFEFVFTTFRHAGHSVVEHGRRPCNSQGADGHLPSPARSAPDFSTGTGRAVLKQHHAF
jgi:hypothetical protein